MQRRFWKCTGYFGVAGCALALGACFPQAQPTVAVAAGPYGGTVVAYPVSGYYSPYASPYAYSPYAYEDGYGLPLGAEYLGNGYGYGYGYGYAPYLYGYQRVIVQQPAPPNRYAVPRGSGANAGVSGQYGLGQFNGGHALGGMHSPPAGWLAPHPANTAHPRFTLPPLRPSSTAERAPAVSRTPGRSAQPRTMAPPSRPPQPQSHGESHRH